jgi:hypothetical protein
MEANIPEKLRAIAREIREQGAADLMRLAVLKNWFEDPRRLRAFAVWVARRSTSGEAKFRGQVGMLFQEARRLFGSLNSAARRLDTIRAGRLLERLRDYQAELQRQRWGPVRIIRNWKLFLVEEALTILLGISMSPTEGFRLASNFAKHYDPDYGSGLNGPSRARVLAIARFVAGYAEPHDHGDRPTRT